MYSTDHTILRDIPANGRVSHIIDRRPVRVATMLDEAAFVEQGNWLRHNRTVFLEDRMHDWDFEPLDKANPDGPGKFRYYTRVAQQADVLLVFAYTDTMPQSAMKFDPMTGQPLAKA